METCDESIKRPKRTFAETWLTDDRYKSWIHKVSFDNSLYYCSICNKNLSCSSSHVSRHADSASHKNNINKNSFQKFMDDNLSIKRARRASFQQRWLEIEEFKCWLREVPHDPSLFACLICDKFIAGGISQIYRHAKSKIHIEKCKSSTNEESKSNEDLNTQITQTTQTTQATQTESLLSFDERRKSAEIRYAALIADKNISNQNAKEILAFFQHVGQDSNVLKTMSMGRTKCKNIITNVLCPIETELVVNKLQNTKFTVFIDETSEVSKKWMTFLVRFVDPETLDIRSQLVKLIDIDDEDTSAEKLFLAFKCEMWKLEILFLNIIALSCDNASIMTGKYLSFKKKLEEECPHLLTFSCPCYSTMLAAHAACCKIPVLCEEFINRLASYSNNNPHNLDVFREFHEYFQETNDKMPKLRDTRWRSYYLCIKKLLESWDRIKKSLNEIVEDHNKEAEDYLRSMMDNLEMKAYLFFLKHALHFFNAFNGFFQVLETRIYLLQPKSLNLLLQICRNFLKKEHLKEDICTNLLFSLKENQKFLSKVNLGSECEKYLGELMVQGHTDVITSIRKNCLMFYVTAAEEIRKRLPVNNIFLSKLHVFTPSISLFDIDRESSFNDVLFVAKTIGGFEEDALKKEWLALPIDLTLKEKQNLSKLSFDNMWKKILQCRFPDNTVRYPNLMNILNAIRSLPNSNTDPKKVLTLLNDLTTKKRNKLSSASVNAICVLKSALQARGETSINMAIEAKHLSLMSADKLYAIAAKKAS